MSCNHEYTNQEARALEKLVIQLEQQLAAANARVAELECKLTAQTEAVLQEKAKRGQAEAQCAAMRSALSEVLACFSDEDVQVTPEMKERWHKALEE